MSNLVKTDGVNQSNINAQKIGAFKIPVPSVEEQKEVVSILKNVINQERKVKQLCEELLQQIEGIKKSILAKAFRGELGTNISDGDSSIELLKSVIEEG